MYDHQTALELENRRLREALDNATHAQVTREQLKTMSTAEVNEARRAGRLREIMTSPNPDRVGGYRHNGNNRPVNKETK